ncbi:MAG: winged helix-turn-helix domain-containing protein [Lentisphaeria bacterium]|nr:MAG: winged helix-turn-helix domain-containing protein [Lentisphaeria bacterium]
MSETRNIQVRHYILSQLENGEETAGSKLPSALEIAGRLNISLLTVQNALATLVNEGVLRTVPRQGTFIDNEWQKRILQTNIGFYVPCETLPWGPSLPIGFARNCRRCTFRQRCATRCSKSVRRSMCR